MHTHTCVHCNPILSHPHPNTIFTEGLSTTSAWYKNILCIRGIQLVESKDMWQMSANGENGGQCGLSYLHRCCRVCLCVRYLYQQRKCQCKEVRTLGKHLCLQDHWNALLNTWSVAHGCELTTHVHTPKRVRDSNT